MIRPIQNLTNFVVGADVTSQTQPSEVGPVNMLDTDLDKADFFV